MHYPQRLLKQGLLNDDMEIFKPFILVIKTHMAPKKFHEDGRLAEADRYPDKNGQTFRLRAC